MQSSISKRFTNIVARASASVALSMLALTSPAHAVLERSGPVSNAPAVGGYPFWYQDTTGMALEMCTPGQSELEGGWCLLGVGDTTVPEVFPTAFADEHFYFAGDASLNVATGGRALVRVAVEAAFATAVQPGDQMVFSRIRVKLVDVPKTGNYRFIHPYGEENIFAEAGAPRGIFFTDDVGLTAGAFDEALNSRLGPFLAASAFPGGPETPAVTAANPTPDTDPAHFGGAFTPTAYPGTGKAYLADPARLGPITGSPLPPFTEFVNPDGTLGVAAAGAPAYTHNLRNHNIFRIEGPPGSNIGGPGIDFIETTDFALMGRVFADAIPGRVGVDRASYGASTNGRRLDVYASGSQTTQGRLPTFPRPPIVVPQLTFFAAPCSADAAGNLLAPTGSTEVQMVSTGTNFFGETLPATTPAGVCLKDAAARDALGNIVPAFFNGTVADEITVTQALFNPIAKTLTVSATSSDAIASPTLTLDGFNVALAGGQVVVPNLSAAPSKIRISSSSRGFAEASVTTGAVPAAPPPPALTAVNDAFSLLEDSGAQTLNIIANDLGATGGAVTLMSSPRLGTAIVNADGSVTYTPSLNANGTDAFTYQVQVGTQISNIANVAITVVAVNDAPTAVNDGPFSVNAGIATKLPDLLANDIDIDGHADLVGVVIDTQPAGATATVGAGAIVTFQAPTPGDYTFTYRAIDAGGLLSVNVGTVTVSVVDSDVVVPASALFRTDRQKRWKVTGTGTSIGAKLHITYDNGSAVGFEIGTAVVDALGNWTLDTTGNTGLADPTLVPAPKPTRLRVISELGGSAAISFTVK